MPNDNVLTAEARATIMDACQSISRRADGLKAGCAIGDEWPDAEDKAFYDAELRLLARLVALLNDSGQSEPETATIARIEQLRKALFESRDAMRVMSNWVKKSDPAGHSWAVRMVDRANAALNGEPEPRFEVMEPKMACRECACLRSGDTCWKCGSETFMPAAGWTEPELPPVARIRELAAQIGYAIGVHGSQERDLDLIAAPWTEDALKLNYREAMQHIADGLGARLVETELKPLGRRACTIQMNGWFKPIDLSVCPMLVQQPEPRSEVTDDDKLCAERYRWLRERAWYVDAVTYALELRERWRSGNEPLPDVDEVECALDAARTQRGES